MVIEKKYKKEYFRTSIKFLNGFLNNKSNVMPVKINNMVDLKTDKSLSIEKVIYIYIIYI